MTVQVTAAAPAAAQTQGAAPVASQTQQTQQTQLKPGTPEYQAEMVRRAENPQQFIKEQQEKQNGNVPSLPEGGFDKFYNKETGAYDWQSHAKELEFKLNGGKKPEQKNDQQQPQGDDKKAEEVVKSVGLNMGELTQEVARLGGKLSPESYAKLEAVGISKEFADAHISAVTELQAIKTAEYAGGKEQLDAAIQFAAKNFSAEEIDSVNKVLASPQWKLGVDTIMSRYLGSRKTAGEPSLIGGVATEGSVAGFASKAEMVDAMAAKDHLGRRKYDIDPAYRAQVRQRIALMGR
jgi:hypothetical protein